LSNVINAAKNLHYNKLIFYFNNKIKTIWNIIKTITGKRPNNAEVQILNTDGKLTSNHHFITDSSNNYFLTIADKININNVKGGYTIESDIDKHWSYLSQVFLTPFPVITFNPTSTKEI
jgi:hypothetical protein